jgi:hypothetical protein
MQHAEGDTRLFFSKNGLVVVVVGQLIENLGFRQLHRQALVDE